MTWAVRIAAAGVVGWAAVAAPQKASDQKPTAVVRYAVPSDLPAGVTKLPGTCAPSRAAWFREDARRCTVETTEYDPCFVTKAGNGGVFLCNMDPNKPASGLLVATDRTLAPSDPRTVAPSHIAWQFELADGTVCKPLIENGREVERLPELYTCKFGTDGHADGVLGELESSQPIWTIRKVLINKKTDPQTIKSFVIAPVKTVWQ